MMIRSIHAVLTGPLQQGALTENCVILRIWNNVLIGFESGCELKLINI